MTSMQNRNEVLFIKKHVTNTLPSFCLKLECTFRNINKSVCSAVVAVTRGVTKANQVNYLVVGRRLLEVMFPISVVVYFYQWKLLTVMFWGHLARIEFQHSARRWAVSTLFKIDLTLISISQRRRSFLSF